MSDHDDDDDLRARPRMLTEFECPDCNAHNPVPDGFHVGDEISCLYCGTEFYVAESNGRIKFKAR